jgi:DNA invertase Pin-like site-specific DNA recombinase
MVQEATVKQWQPAIYARLSDDDGRAGVSLSIEHQLEILKAYVQDKGWQPPKVFYDDDKTGTNFDRKGFQDMYSEAQKGNVNVIVIKDTSRFGRNWVKSGDYFEKIEEMGVRFISIQEGLDTADPNCPALKMLPFYFIFNEWHSQTTSEKIKTVLANNAKQGKYRTSFAPYGFQKDPNDKHKLVVDPYSASIVKRIYELRLQKYSYGAIVNILNDEGVLSPSAYCISVHGKSTNVASKQNKWTKDSLNVLFQNPAYKGDTANGKKTNASYKSNKRIRQPVSEWIIVENTHEPIVSREDWQKCNDMIKTLGRVRRTKESEILPFTGILVCPDCGYQMRHNHSYYTLKS